MRHTGARTRVVIGHQRCPLERDITSMQEIANGIAGARPRRAVNFDHRWGLDLVTLRHARLPNPQVDPHNTDGLYQEAIGEVAGRPYGGHSELPATRVACHAWPDWRGCGRAAQHRSVPIPHDECGLPRDDGRLPDCGGST